MIGIILIRMDLNAPLKVGFCIYTSTLNATSTVGESQGKGREGRLLKIRQPEF